MKPRFLDEATAELYEAMEWYDDQRDGLGEEFQDAVDEAIRLVLAAPGQYPVYEGSRTSPRFRRVLLKRFPYYIVFEMRPDEPLIVAAGYWRNR